MATYNLNLTGKLDASDTNCVLVDNGGYYQHSTGAVDTITLPKASTAGNKSRFVILRDGAGVLTIAARSGETYVGDTTLSQDGDGLLVFKTGDLEWTGLVQPVAAAA